MPRMQDTTTAHSHSGATPRSDPSNASGNVIATSSTIAAMATTRSTRTDVTADPVGRPARPTSHIRMPSPPSPEGSSWLKNCPIQYSRHKCQYEGGCSRSGPTECTIIDHRHADTSVVDQISTIAGNSQTSWTRAKLVASALRSTRVTMITIKAADTVNRRISRHIEFAIFFSSILDISPQQLYHAGLRRAPAPPICLEPPRPLIEIGFEIEHTISSRRNSLSTPPERVKRRA